MVSLFLRQCIRGLIYITATQLVVKWSHVRAWRGVNHPLGIKDDLHFRSINQLFKEFTRQRLHNGNLNREWG